MNKVILDTDADIIYCPICQKYKLIKDGVFKVKAAINDDVKYCQDRISLYSYFMVICSVCYKDIFKKRRKNDYDPDLDDDG